LADPRDDKGRLSVFENRIVRMGALAGACAAILGLGLKLSGLFSSSEPPAASAHVTAVDIGDLVGIRAAFDRIPSVRACADLASVRRFQVSAPRSASRLSFASMEFAQTRPGVGEDSDGPTLTTPKTTPTQTSTETEPKTVPIIKVPTGKLLETVSRTIILRSGLPVIDRVVPRAGQVPRSAPAPQTLALTDGSASEDERQDVAAEALLVRADGGNSAEPVGRLVDISVAIKGLRRHCVQVRWSLYEADSAVRVREGWLRDQPGSRVIPDSQETETTTQVWVPLPRRGGRFFVKLGMFDDRGTRFDVARTEPFKQAPGDAQGFLGS
jgi:hypothetical protein